MALSSTARSSPTPPKSHMTSIAPAIPTTSTDIRVDDCITFLRTLDTGSVDLIVTDPAYSGMNQHLRLGHGRIVGRYSSPDNDDWFQEFEDDPEQFSVFLSECGRVLRDGRHLYIMFDTFSLLSLGAIVRDHFGVKGVIVWDKVSMGMGNYFRRQHEFILFAAKGRRSINSRDITDVWSIRRLHKRSYPTQKPVELFQRMIKASASPGYVVCDPFTGSGTAAIAALTAGCTFVGCDASKDAVRIARERVQVFLNSGIDPLEKAPPRQVILEEQVRQSPSQKPQRATARRRGT